ncbi:MULTISPECIES: DEAD/DEAH box helicase [unclassified Mycoplasma]|uniref:DEAD/DEAH box helicase n=1 Tax=unclassified Mycoplasma TaxID=2683645 RepID=UPI00211C7DC8|nr:MULTISPECIES: DEAD/DEAH box helicase [unclassified Mycoplasma]UUM19789.1 DEAD/DEAH box helicase [Mycoplasma sp. 1578d]UUM24773.1 DEAD/DEAH box helicase [Mycoplasma sp. 3686d]
MNTNKEIISVQENRDIYIRELKEAKDNKKEKEWKIENADSLFHLGLNMYSEEYSFKSAIYNAFAYSHIDENISLHPEQMKILSIIEENEGIIFSAPTSFGKTFVVFEYIAKHQPKNVVLIVPTLALVDEYKQKIIRRYKDAFKNYKLYISVDLEKTPDFNKSNLFILTPERVIHNSDISLFSEIDFLVIDEVYKLKTDPNDERVLILNLAYKNLMRISKKYLLLAPFLKEIQNTDKLEKKPIFFSSDFSPVVNDVITYSLKIKKKKKKNEIKKERNKKIIELIKKLKDTKLLVYFPTVNFLNKFINNLNTNNKVINRNKKLENFIEWASKEIHEEWTILKALKNNILVHHGQISLGIRMFQLSLFDDIHSQYNIMLCTSTLLEGVNTACENIIITEPKIRDKNFDAFDFFNLIGRTGRLSQHYLGTAHYIQGPDDSEYHKKDALKSIQFELTDQESIDMDINSENYKKHPDFLQLLKDMDISYEEYKTRFAMQFRFSTIKNIYNRFKQNKLYLYDAIKQFSSKGKRDIVKEIYKIIEGIEKIKFWDNIKINIIHLLTYKSLPNVRNIVEEILKKFNFKKSNTNAIINEVLKIKNSYLEHTFYKKIIPIIFFMQLDNVSEEKINVIETHITKVIENKYFLNSPLSKMLKDMGIYDLDIQKIKEIIGDNFESIDQLILLLRENYQKIKNKISVISKFVIEKMII